MAFADAATSRAWVGSGGQVIYCGPDHCSKPGAEALAFRLAKYWAERGVSKAYSVDFLHSSTSDVYTVREIKKPPPKAPEAPPPTIFKVGPTPRQRIVAEIKRVLARDFPDIGYDQLMRSTGTGRRPIRESAARRQCLEAVLTLCKKINPDGISLPRLGRIFNLDHTAVLHCVSHKSRQTRNVRVLKRYHELKAAA